MAALALCASVPIAAGAALLAAFLAEAAADNSSPYVSLGIAGVLLGVIVVPTFRWLMQRVDRQQEQQEKLIAALQESVDQHGESQAEARRVHDQLLAAAERTNHLLLALQPK